MTSFEKIAQECPLGRTTEYVENYAPDKLFPIPRTLAREKSGIDSNALPFDGVDYWNGVELSWLNPKGKPAVATIELCFPCTAPMIVESKSIKLYLNSFTQSTFSDHLEVQNTITKDLSAAAGKAVNVIVTPLQAIKSEQFGRFPGHNLDHLDIETHCYQVNPDFLICHEGPEIEETLCSELLKSNCMATGQPDWGAIQIHYHGKRIDHAGLLKYIISYRQHVGFGEHCVEQIFKDILERCRPDRLSVYARYTKRGGLDICPFRTNSDSTPPPNIRHFRQ